MKNLLISIFLILGIFFLSGCQSFRLKGGGAGVAEGEIEFKRDPRPVPPESIPITTTYTGPSTVDVEIIIKPNEEIIKIYQEDESDEAIRNTIESIKGLDDKTKEELIKKIKENKNKKWWKKTLDFLKLKKPELFPKN